MMCMPSAGALLETLSADNICGAPNRPSRAVKARTGTLMTKHQSTHELEPATLVPAQGELRGHTTPEQISHDTPLRLQAAAAIAFPDGGMTANGLRRESKRGRLVIERVAGKDYTTLNHIKRMRELCHVSQARRDSGNGRNGGISQGNSVTLPPGLSSMAVASSALDSTLQTLTERTAPLPPTSTDSTNRRRRPALEA